MTAEAIEATRHATALAVWGVPSTVSAGERFAIKVGAKSSAGCALTGGRIEVIDAAGAALGSARLGATPWPDTQALYWAEVELVAPPSPGAIALAVQFDAADLDTPHESAASSFGVTVLEPAACTLTVRVTDKANATPIGEAQIRLGPYRGVTDETGCAAIRLAKGRYELIVWKAGYETPAITLDIAADAAVDVAAVPQPEEDPDARWTA